MTGREFRRLLLAGDSMIEFFDWQRRFPDRIVKNLGRSGESVEELQDRVHYIVDQNMGPDLVLIMIGTNNVAMENFNFLKAYGMIIDTFQQAYPEATLLVNSLLPMELGYLAPDTVARVNSSLRGLAATAGAAYLDVWAKMVDRSGRVLDGLLEDEVHLNANGYRLWAGELEKFLTNGQGN